MRLTVTLDERDQALRVWVEQAAARFGIEPGLIDRRDDDAAIDGHTDLLVDALAGPARREVS